MLADDVAAPRGVEVRLEPLAAPCPPARHRADLGPGESWYTAARALVAERLPELSSWWLLPEDLGGPWKRFVLVEHPGLSFRPLTRGDLPDLIRWQSAPHVAPWWHDGARDRAAAEDRYLPIVAGEDRTTEVWVAEVHGRSVGIVQAYRIADHPDWALLTARPDAVGWDYLIGEQAFVGRGLGTRLLAVFLDAWLRRVGREAGGVAEVFAAPDHRNLASLRVLDKLGFRRGLWFDAPGPTGATRTVVGCSLDVSTVHGALGATSQ